MGERTGSRVFQWVWSYVFVFVILIIIKEHTDIKEQEEKMYSERKMRAAQAEMARVAAQKKEELEKKLDSSYWGSFAAILGAGAASIAAVAAASATGRVSLAAMPKIYALVGVTLAGRKVSRDSARRAALEGNKSVNYTNIYTSDSTPRVTEIGD
ncbi:hypothetical protein QBC45DRAFT_89718 [Copromyces sp. CBS 386.78]|nr:hypothetical protein QBC45DRAFT_89718 [Copromyces sp. CBS 386.78]